MNRVSILRWIGLAAMVSLGAAAVAQDVQGDPSQGTGPMPSPNVAPAPPLCTDRPTKATVACTVPAGSVQIETDAVNWTRQTMDGERQDTLLYTNPTIKLGVGTHTDVEVNLAPYETVHMRDADGRSSRLGGVGDLYLRVKQRLTADDSKTQMSIVPYIKVPTARASIGGGAWEGGVIGAINVPLPAHFTLNLSPEVDVLGNGSGNGHHAAIEMLASLSHPVTKKIDAFVELWTDQDRDPTQPQHQYSVDLALAYQLAHQWEIDAGGNFGLNRETPAKQLYLGLSTRF